MNSAQSLRIVNSLGQATLATARVVPARSARCVSSSSAARQAQVADPAPSSSSFVADRSVSAPASFRASSSSQHLYSSPPSTQQSFLKGLLSPVSPLPNPQLLDTLIAERCLTHKSGVDKRSTRGRLAVSDNEPQEGGKNGHNEKMSFVGRRILRLYLTLHLNSKLSTSHPSLLAHAVSPQAIDALLNTKQLGATVGAAWKLEDAMRWREVKGPTGEMTGLWKVRGMGVEAVMGGVFTSQGIETASKVFHQLVLPNLTFPQTLQKALDGTSTPSPVTSSVDQSL